LALTVYGTNDPKAVKLWSKRLNVEVLKTTWLTKFMSSDPSSIIEVKDELSKSAGDKVTFSLRMQMDGDGILGDNTLEGSEEALVTYSDALFIDQLRHATGSQGKMSEQRVPFSVREHGMGGLRDWWAGRIDESGFNQLCGYTPQTDVRRTGLQAVIAPDANHIVRPLAGETTDQDIASTSVFTLSLIDKAVERSRTLTPAIRGTKIGGKETNVVFLHPYHVTDLRTNTSTGQWLDITKAAMQGGEIGDNPIYDGSLGMYNGCVMHMDSRVTNGVNSVTGADVPTVKRAVFLGAQAAAMAYGRDNGPERFTWVEKLFDFDHQLRIAAGLIFGMKKTVYNGADYGTIVLSSYGVAH